jgi:hypothetical protein
VPKCEICYVVDSHHFHIIKAPWIGDFGTKKKSKNFHFGHYFEVVLAKMLGFFAHSENTPTKIFWEAKAKLLLVTFELI